MLWHVQVVHRRITHSRCISVCYKMGCCIHSSSTLPNSTQLNMQLTAANSEAEMSTCAFPSSPPLQSTHFQQQTAQLHSSTCTSTLSVLAFQRSGCSTTATLHAFQRAALPPLNRMVLLQHMLAEQSNFNLCGSTTWNTLWCTTKSPLVWLNQTECFCGAQPNWVTRQLRLQSKGFFKKYAAAVPAVCGVCCRCAQTSTK